MAPPFTLTAAGTAIGLLAPADTNCCATHNAFNLPPPGSALVVAETDSTGLAETLFASGASIGPGGGIGGPGGTAARTIPTLSEWGLIVLMTLLAIAGLITTRRYTRR